MSADSNASLPLMDEVVSGRNLSSFTSASARASPDLT